MSPRRAHNSSFSESSFAADPNHKVLVRTVEEEIKFGADAIRFHLIVGPQNKSEMLAAFRQISERCDNWGTPLLTMMYLRGDKVEDEHE